MSVAAANAPESTVVSGRLEELAEVERRLASTGVETRRLVVSHAFHSPQMEPIADEFARRAAALEFRAPTTRIVSSVTGRELTLAELRQPEYWRRQVRQAVEFQSAMTTLADAGFDTFVEVGPTATLTGFGRQCIGREGQVWVPSLRRDTSDARQMLESIGVLHVHGVDVDLAALDKRSVRRRVALPTYPFERQRYWIGPQQPLPIVSAAPEGQTSPHAEASVEAPEAPRYPRPELDTPYIAPRNDVERFIAGLYQEFLGIDRVGVDDDFFEFGGGDSLVATRVITRLKQTYQVRLSMRDIFEMPTVADLAQYIAKETSHE